MSEAGAQATAPPVGGLSAGGMLRKARQAQGLHIAALSAAIKVSQRKLELLESDQFDQLPDATFTRALAQTVCRTLKVDAAPILALLPPVASHRLEQVSEGLNMPFADRPGRLVPREWATLTSPALWLAALLVLGTLAVYFMPAGWLPAAKKAGLGGSAAPASAPAAGASESAPAQAVALPASVGASASVDAAASAAAAASEPLASASAGIGEPVAPVPEPAVARLVEVRTTAASWVEIVDASGVAVLSRLLQPGEAVPLEGALPMKVRIGNASGTQISLRGQPVVLAPYTRDNIARLELK